MPVLHIAHRSDWESAVLSGAYETSTRGLSLADQGFIHASHPHQVSRVAARVHSDDPEDLVVLVIDPSAVRADGVEIREEDGGSGELFPHIYGPIRPAWVVEARPARFEDGDFAW
ncbi:DUF952 domain-containing protein [Demequina sp. SO4-13]|uniref:DUF952 domain-containing protein n=1 Tax=Demequina sp. SO4-13 TaxID=3401027 RepID=UPI003AF83AB6